MLKFIHGTDKGNVFMTALVLIMVLSIFFLSFVPRIISVKQFSHDYKINVIREIEQSNKEILGSYDFN